MKKLLECLNLYHSDKCGHEDIDYRHIIPLIFFVPLDKLLRLGKAQINLALHSTFRNFVLNNQRERI